jgi:hypothetical protein
MLYSYQYCSTIKCFTIVLSLMKILDVYVFLIMFVEKTISLLYIVTFSFGQKYMCSDRKQELKNVFDQYSPLCDQKVSFNSCFGYQIM